MLRRSCRLAHARRKLLRGRHRHWPGELRPAGAGKTLLTPTPQLAFCSRDRIARGAGARFSAWCRAQLRPVENYGFLRLIV